MGSRAVIAIAALAGLGACGNDIASPPQPPPATANCQKTYPELSGRVVDEAQLLSPAEEVKLTERLAALEARTKHQMVVATVSSLQDMSIEAYSQCLANHWAVGRKGVNDGVVFTVAPVERQTRIEVGKGLTGKLTDNEAKAILGTDVTTQFRNGNYPAGIAGGATAIMREVQ